MSTMATVEVRDRDSRVPPREPLPGLLLPNYLKYTLLSHRLLSLRERSHWGGEHIVLYRERQWTIGSRLN